jgi:hypothetical protein
MPLGLEEPLAGKTDVDLPPQHSTLPSPLRNAGHAVLLSLHFNAPQQCSR